MILAVDTETTGLDFFHGCNAFLVTACDGESNYWFWGQVNPYTREVFWDEDVIAEVQELVDSANKLVFHNTQFDMRALDRMGVKTEHLWNKIEDTVVAAHCLCSGDIQDLKNLSIKYLHYWDDDEKELDSAVQDARKTASAQGWSIAKHGHPHFPGAPKTSTFWKQDFWLCTDECLRYALCDVERTWLLWDAFKIGLENDGLVNVYNTRKKLLKICYDMTEIGMSLDIDHAKKMIENLENKALLIRKYLEKDMGIRYKFNWDRKVHLVSLIHHHLDIPVKFTTETGEPSTDKKAIKYYIEEYPSKQLNALKIGRRIQKEARDIKSYIRWTDEKGVVHSGIKVTGTRETRQSSSDPNTQNVNSRIKKLFTPLPGYIWVDFDMVNIELRIWAYTSGNKELIEAFESGRSVHQMVFELLYPSEYKRWLKDPSQPALKAIYTRMKNGTFGIIYGATEETSDAAYGYSGATKKVYNKFPGVQEFTQRIIGETESNKVDFDVFSIFTLGGYRLDVPSDEPFKACNFFVQGSAGYFVGLQMIALTENPDYIRSGTRMNNQVHDSIRLQIPIQPGLRKLIHSFAQSIEEAPVNIFGPTPVDWEVRYHPDDKDNPLLQELF